MDEEKYQKELFEFEKPKRLFPRLSNLLPKADFEGRIVITLTLEKVIFIAIGIIMLMVVVYAVGIERGRTVNKDITIRTIGQPVAAKEAQSQTMSKAPQFLSVEPIAATNKSVPKKAMASSVKAVAAPMVDATKPYTIVGVTLTSKDTATAEMNKFRQEGLEAYMVRTGQYYQVCVGSYANKENAQKTLVRIRQTFKDAYIRSR